MSVTINGTNGLTFNDNTTQATSPFAGGLGFRNRIINGDMRIDQRNAGASVTPASIGNTYTLDRWEYSASQASKASLQQSSTAPTGSVNSLLVTSLSAYTVGASEVFTMRQKIEGVNVADLAWGTASASSVTLSFWVRSSLTGTFGGSLQNSGFGRSYPFTYTINSANTWEQKAITIAGDTSGTWLTTTSIGIIVNFGLGVGSSSGGTAGSWASADYRSATGATSIVGTNGATFYITGVQLEKGSTTTSFDYRDYGRELIMCQRYYYRRTYASVSDVVANLQAYAAGSAWGKLMDLPVEMRATPTGSFSSVTHFLPTNTGGNGTTAFSAGGLGQGTNRWQLCTGGLTGSSGLTAGNATVVMVNTAGAWLDVSAEL